jgi:outer membrane protein assembly factor BamB
MTKASKGPCATVTPSDITTALAGASACEVGAADWPQFRGPNHDGSSPEKILTSGRPPACGKFGKQPMTDGFSAITLGGGKAFTLEAREVNGANQEVCVALDANTGKELWACRWASPNMTAAATSGTPDNSGGDGPRSTPTYDGGKVYTYSSQMVLKCMDAASGKQIWACDMKAEHAGTTFIGKARPRL